MSATISTAGVLRCCLASVGGDYVLEHDDWKAFEDPQPGAKDTCEYCGRQFTLDDELVWRAEEYKENEDANPTKAETNPQ